MKYDQIKDIPDKKSRRLTGLKRPTFNKMVDMLKLSDKERKAKGSPNHKGNIENSCGWLKGNTVPIFI